MKLIYKGDGDHRVTTAFGVDFPQGQVVEVHESHPAARLAANPMFDVEPEPESDPEPEPEPAVEAEPSKPRRAHRAAEA